VANRFGATGLCYQYN